MGCLSSGDRAGALSVEQLIRLLNDRLTIEILLELITWRLTEMRNPITAPCCSARVSEPRLVNCEQSAGPLVLDTDKT
jgi:hypothetical protein